MIEKKEFPETFKHPDIRDDVLYSFYTERESNFYDHTMITDLVLHYIESQKENQYGHHLFKVKYINKNNNVPVEKSNIILMDYELNHLTELGPIENYPEYFI
jgi:hypothetical protein